MFIVITVHSERWRHKKLNYLALIVEFAKLFLNVSMQAFDNRVKKLTVRKKTLLSYDI